MKNYSAEEKEIISLVSQYVDLSVHPFGENSRSILEIEKRDPMYGGNGVVYMLPLYASNELANNRIGSYMILPHKGDQAGFHEHGTKKEQEVYVIINGVGEYIERVGEQVTKTVQLQKGAVTNIQGDNNFHSLINIGEEPLIVFVISTYQK